MFICLHLNERLQPIHRADIEDCLQDALEEFSFGEVTGGGTLMAKNGEISSCDIDIDFSGNDEDFKRFLDFINDLTIAKGSALEKDGQKIPVGRFEGMGIYLSTNLPDEVYKNSDVNELIAKLNTAIGETGVLRSWRELNEFTALYYYGSSFEEMKSKAEPVLSSHPLAQDCNVVQTA